MEFKKVCCTISYDRNHRIGGIRSSFLPRGSVAQKPFVILSAFKITILCFGLPIISAANKGLFGSTIWVDCILQSN